MIEWISKNTEWFFSGIGVFLIGGIWKLFNRGEPINGPALSNSSSIVINNTNGARSANEVGQSEMIDAEKSARSLESCKNETHILFIDDDVKFKVAKILSKSGWVHTKLIKDAITLDDQEILRADILFIDVQGVGVSLGFSDEGLGLALAIKDKYPRKKVVIYSAETKGDRFHQALRKADSFLPKNADPYEFQKIVEDFTVGAKA